ncbi:MAG: glycosyltransferase family 4 protein [Gammaproteobacteria bacterium]|nr:glycosyltransferase family 4 protein [Gammaproteobacteria bacterium]
MSEAPLRLAVRALGGARWAGGTTYMANLLEALKSYAPDIRVQLVARRDQPEHGYTRVITFSPFSSHRLVRLVDRLVESRVGENPGFARQLGHALAGQADVVFAPNHNFMGLKHIPGLYWIPDFQHLHLPDLFSRDEVARRDREFRIGLERARRVLVSSDDARGDLAKFFPRAAEKATVVHFVARVPEGAYDKDPMEIARRYHLPEKFLYLPNQFWTHKNHRLVVDALALLGERKLRPVVVCSGNFFDRRDPAFAADLLCDIARLGLRDRFITLGLVPHDDVYALMRQSVAVINPSLFEGWSTSVEEAKSLGKRVLLSDLGVHREQAPPKGQYFDRHSVEDCAHCIGEVWREVDPGPDRELETAARAALPVRTREYATRFASLARQCVLPGPGAP